jgi:hypothetical protein
MAILSGTKTNLTDHIKITFIEEENLGLLLTRFSSKLVQNQGGNIFTLLKYLPNSFDLKTQPRKEFRRIIKYTTTKVPCWVGSLSSWHGASSDCGLRSLQIWRVAANILNKQSQTGEKGWSSSLEVGRWANNLLP